MRVSPPCISPSRTKGKVVRGGNSEDRMAFRSPVFKVKGKARKLETDISWSDGCQLRPTAPYSPLCGCEKT